MEGTEPCERNVKMMKELASLAQNESDLVSLMVINLNIEHVVEVGYRDLEKVMNILKKCPYLERYYIISKFQESDLEQAKKQTSFASEVRVFLSGDVGKMIDKVSEKRIDMCIIDGPDLRSNIIGLISLYPLIKMGGFVLFSRKRLDTSANRGSIFVIPFAEANKDKIYLYKDYYIIEKMGGAGYEFIDLTLWK